MLQLPFLAVVLVEVAVDLCRRYGSLACCSTAKLAVTEMGKFPVYSSHAAVVTHHDVQFTCYIIIKTAYMYVVIMNYWSFV